MPRRSIIALTALAVFITGVVAWWVNRSPTVSAMSMSLAPLVRTLQFSARVVTSSRVDVGSTLTGRVQQVTIEEGAQVKKGDVLVRLENDELSAAVEQAKANERQAIARLSGLRSTGRSSTQAGLSQADSVLVAAQAELQRTQALVSKGFISQARLDETLRAVAVAQAQQTSARAQITANAEQGTDIHQAQAQLALASAAIAAAKARLAQAVLTAPADAKVLARTVEPGQIVQPGRTLLSLALASRLQLLAQVDERYLDQLRVGQTASVVADAFPNQRFAARLQTIAPLVDAQRGAVEVKLSLPPEPPDFLREDMTLSVEVETARRESALVVPIGALRSDDTSSIAVVWIEVGGQVEERKVHLGIRSLNTIEVLEGLVIGDKVLIGASPSPGARVHLKAVTTEARPIGKSASDGIGSALTNAMGR
jgi:HlyD family secretion protein